MADDPDALLGSFMQEVEALSGPDTQVVPDSGATKVTAAGESEDRSQASTAVRKTIGVAPPAPKTIAAAPPSHVSKTIAAAPPSHAVGPTLSASYAASGGSHAQSERGGAKRDRDHDGVAGASYPESSKERAVWRQERKQMWQRCGGSRI